MTWPDIVLTTLKENNIRLAAYDSASRQGLKPTRLNENPRAARAQSESRENR